MFPAASVSSAAAKPAQPAQAQTAQKTTQPQAPETARTSSGESAAANVKAETTKAVQAPEQSSVAPRLRDQETFERTERVTNPKDLPAGPPPTFEESPLERQARVALDPPDQSVDPEDGFDPVDPDANPAPADAKDDAVAQNRTDQTDPPPTPTERAEASFSETKTISEDPTPASVDVRN